MKNERFSAIEIIKSYAYHYNLLKKHESGLIKLEKLSYESALYIVSKLDDCIESLNDIQRSVILRDINRHISVFNKDVISKSSYYRHREEAYEVFVETVKRVK